MGLDMYLKAENYMNPRWGTEEEKKTYAEIRSKFPEIKDTDNINSMEISFEVGYWRKANAIHKWFIDNCARGNDDCNPVYVDRKQLEDLLLLCKDVMKKVKMEDGKVANGSTLTENGWKENFEDGKVVTNPEVVAELLPTENGFFFGSTNYDEWYISDIKRTIEILEYALSLPDKYDFYYRASW